jgi:hypothetical protein
MNARRSARLIGVPVIILGLAFAFAFLSGGSEKRVPASALQNALYSPGGEAGEVSRTQVEQFWQTRLTYPTGRFDQHWVAAAAKQANRIKAGIPAGHYRPWRGAGRASAAGAATALSAARPLGPQPQESTGCQPACFTFGLVSGRVSAIAFDPVNTNVAYLAQDGGGIWKTTNCCSPATTWTVKTDGASVTTTAVDDVTVDPKNPNVVSGRTTGTSSTASGSARARRTRPPG